MHSLPDTLDMSKASVRSNQHKMSSDLVTPSVEQRCTIKCVVNKKMNPTEILRMLNVRRDRETCKYQ
jgi:hypothetical protein